MGYIWLLVIHFYIWYCLPDSFYFIFYIPETSSRVTLATLGISFQPNLSVLLFGCLVVWLLNWQFLMFVNTFSCTFSEKYFLSFVIPPFHLCIVTTLIISSLHEVELWVEYRWNYIKFHPYSTHNSTTSNTLTLKHITYRGWKGGTSFA